MSYYGYQAPPYGQPPQQQYGQQPYQYNQQQYQQPPPGQYQQPPHGQYQQPPPGQYQQPPQGQYQQPPPGQYQQPPYGAPPPQGQYQQQPPLNNYYQQSPPPNQYPPQQPPQELYAGQPPQQWGPPSPAPYGQPQSGYGQQPPQQPPHGTYPPTPPSLGYGPPQIIAWDGRNDANALRKAMKGFGTDEKTLIRVLANLDPLQVATVRDTYQKLFPKHNLIDDIRSETSGWFEKGLVALARGPLLHDVYLLHDAMDGPGTKEKVLNDILLGRSNADIAAIKSTYAQIHRGQSLEAKVRGDLSMKTERHFMMVLAGNRNEDSQPVIQAEVDRDVMDLYKATEGKLGTDELLVCDIFTHRNDAQLRAIAQAYQQKFRVKLEDVIKKEFSGHMEDALLFQLRHACDKYMHCARLLEDAMAGMGTKDHLLVSRVVRFHWNKHDMANIRGAYQKLRGTPLPQRIKGETSGDYERLMLACIGEH